MRDEIITGAVGTGLSAVGTATQLNEVLQTISLCLTIAGALVTFIVMPLIAWYQKSKKDGKIDKDEIKEGIDIVVTGGEKVKEEIDKNKGDK